jgi:hypothetical protein
MSGYKTILGLGSLVFEKPTKDESYKLWLDPNDTQKQRPKIKDQRSGFAMSRYDQKLEFILRNAARIFAEKSYHSTSMRDISRATGVSFCF